MPEETTRRVLLVGGHLDGHWMTLPAFQYRVQAIEPHVPVLDPGDDPRPLPSTEWDLQPISFGFRPDDAPLWVGILTTLHGRERRAALMRAIFQRDVAQELLAER